MNEKEERKEQPEKPQILPSSESGEREILTEELVGKEDKGGLINQPQGSVLSNSGNANPDQPIPREVQAGSEAKPNTPESPEKAKERDDQLGESQVSATRDQASDKSDKVEPNKTSTNDQSHQKPFDPADLLYRDLKKVKASVDSSLIRFSRKVDELLDPENEDENKE